MKRKDSFDSLVIDNAPDREGFVNAAALAGDYCPGKYLGALFVAFFYTAVDIYNIAYFEVRCFFPQTFTLYRIQYFRFHFLYLLITKCTRAHEHS